MKLKRWIWSLVIAVPIIGAATGAIVVTQIKHSETKQDVTSYEVEWVYDGDTIKLTDGKKVRFRGVDTPETLKPSTVGKLAKYENYYAEKATEYVYDVIKKNKNRVYLDITGEDKYGRLVAIVYLDKAKNLKDSINNLLVEHGFARVAYITVNNKHSIYNAETELEINLYNILMKSQQEAQAKKLEIFSHPLNEVFYKGY
ncbi:thermonuclease family protein [Mycoplasma hafezii]|uniref:thermonuclease family protein n=1 Tax=Mycoplasma hafezii TaxID=525886 RepID=UPI003CF0BB99